MSLCVDKSLRLHIARSVKLIDWLIFIRAHNKRTCSEMNDSDKLTMNQDTRKKKIKKNIAK